MPTIATIDLDQITDTMQAWIWSLPLFLLLLGCGLIFSVVSKFVQWRVLTHGYSCIRGHYDRPEDTGHINHFQALCAALSATIGLGNIAGVAIAVSLGGPGAVFWMWIVGLFGMALKFMECSLAVMFRDVRGGPDSRVPVPPEAAAGQRAPQDSGDRPPEPGAASGSGGRRIPPDACPHCGTLLRPDARYCPTCGATVEKLADAREVRGGPMWYIQKGLADPLKERGSPLWVVFRVLAILFAAATILNTFGSGNMFQGWNVSDMLHKNFHVPNYISAAIVSFLVALVIIGGIKRIGTVAARLVPVMCVVYVLAAVYVISLHVSETPYYLALIVRSAFTPQAEGGAFAGVSVWIAFTWGLKRACFSNEAGEGSAAMAHAAAKTEEPIREGVVAGIGPFVDTLIICTMSALVLLMTGTWNRAPVGTVAAIKDGTARIECVNGLPPRFEQLYLERLQNPTRTGSKFSIHTARGENTEFEEVKIEIPKGVVPDGSDSSVRWEDLGTLTLDLSGVDQEERPAIAVGQPVHLDMQGAELTRFAFDTTMHGFGTYIVTVAVCLFAFSTMISWSYYGEKGAEYLLGQRAILPYKFVFVIFVFLGMVLQEFKWVYNFSDATVGLMVLCNLPAVLILSPTVLRAAKDYFWRLDGGEMVRRF